MSTRKLVVWIVFLALFAMAARFSVDTDTWWHLRSGQWIVEHQAILEVDPFSYTRSGQSWQYPGWLVQIPMFLLYNNFGPGGLNIWTAGIVVLTFAFIWPVLIGGPFLRAFILVLAATVSGVYWAARPYMVTFLLAAIFLSLLERYRWRSDFNPRWLLLLPLLMVVWVNSHGGFAVGFILLGVYIFNEGLHLVFNWGRSKEWFSRSEYFQENKPDESTGKSTLDPVSSPLGLSKFSWLIMIAVLSALALLINPSGVAMAAYPFKTVEIKALQAYIQEWQSPNFHSLSVQPFAWLILLTFGVVGAARKRLALTDFLLFAGFAYIGLLAGRNIALFSLVAPVVLSRHCHYLLEDLSQATGRYFGVRPSKTSRLLGSLNLILLGLLVMVAGLKAASVFPSAVNQAYFDETMPVGVVDFLHQENPPGRLFNSYNWGGYLLWAIPEYPVFIDGRTDLYNDEIINEWLAIMRAETGWQEILERWQVRLILVEPGTPLLLALEGTEWQLLYKDEISILYGR